MKIAIIGGGSAGWITLSYLAATIDCELTIIHSNEIDPIGVGESTTPTIKHVADTVGVDEKQWMKDSQATFKYGVEFLNFNNIGSRWVHTFDDMLPHQTFHRPITENGKDLYKKEEYYTYFRVLESDDEYFDYFRKRHAFWKMYGLNLPDPVLKKIYYENALKLFPTISKDLFK